MAEWEASGLERRQTVSFPMLGAHPARGVKGSSTVGALLDVLVISWDADAWEQLWRPYLLHVLMRHQHYQEAKR